MYATPQDMLDRWGETEMVRLTVADSQESDRPDIDRMVRALEDASDVADGYLRVRYSTPLATPAPAALVRVICILARHDLAHGENRVPTDQMIKAREEVIRWLRDVADGRVQLDVPAAPVAGGDVLFQDREAVFRAGDGPYG